MRFKKLYFLGLVIPIFFSSCLVLHNGNVSSGPLVNINDRYVDIARGEAKSVFVFGLGDLENDVLLFDAKNNLFINRPLQKGEYYANFTSDVSKKFILFFIAINKVTISAEVLRVNDTSNTVLSKSFKDIIRINNEKLFFVSETDTFKVNDKVYYNYDADATINTKNFNLYKIVAINKKEVNLKPMYSNKENEVVIINNAIFYSTTKNLKDYKIGDKVKAIVYDGIGGKSAEYGTIVATRNGFAIVQTLTGYYSVAPISLEHITDENAIKDNTVLIKNKQNIKNGDSLYAYSSTTKKYNLYIASDVEKENVMLKSTTPEEQNALKSLNYKFYYKNGTVAGFKNGDKVSIEVDNPNSFNFSTFEGIVLGIYKETILVKTTEGSFYVVEKNRIKKLN